MGFRPQMAKIGLPSAEEGTSWHLDMTPGQKQAGTAVSRQAVWLKSKAWL